MFLNFFLRGKETNLNKDGFFRSDRETSENRKR